MTTHLETLFDRLEVCLKESLAAISVTPAVSTNPYHIPADFPCWIAYLEAFTPRLDSEEFQRRDYTITAELAIGHVTEDYDGALHRKMLQYIPTVLDYFTSVEHRHLQSETYTTYMNDIAPLGLDVTRVSGSGQLQRGGGGIFGTQFQFVVPIHITVQGEEF